MLLAAEGCTPAPPARQVTYRDGKRTVIDGPFAEAKELIAGYLLIQVASREEAIEWALRCPVEIAPSADGVRRPWWRCARSASRQPPMTAPAAAHRRADRLSRRASGRCGPAASA